MGELASSLRAIIAEQLHVSIEEVSEKASLKDTLGSDKARRSSLTAALSHTFDINISDEDTSEFNTTGDVYRYVETKLWWYSL